jgi:hypothetical protein
LLAFAEATNANSTIQVIMVSFFYFLNPMFTFYLANYQIVANFFNQQFPDLDPLVIPLVGGLNASFGLSLGCFMFQFILYFSIVMMKDQKQSFLFKKKDGNTPKLSQK